MSIKNGYESIIRQQLHVVNCFLKCLLLIEKDNLNEYMQNKRQDEMEYSLVKLSFNILQLFIILQQKLDLYVSLNKDHKIVKGEEKIKADKEALINTLRKISKNIFFNQQYRQQFLYNIEQIQRFHNRKKNETLKKNSIIKKPWINKSNLHSDLDT